MSEKWFICLKNDLIIDHLFFMNINMINNFIIIFCIDLLLKYIIILNYFDNLKINIWVTYMVQIVVAKILRMQMSPKIYLNR